MSSRLCGFLFGSGLSGLGKYRTDFAFVLLQLGGFMMDLDIFDVDIVLGTPSVPLDSENGYFASEGEIVDEMDRFSISRCAVRHIYGKEYSPLRSNEKLDALDPEHLKKCYTLLPQYTGEMGTEDEIMEYLGKGDVQFVTFYPITHNYPFSAHTLGPLLGLLAESDMIVLIEKDEIEYERMYEICRHLPELNLIILGIAYRDNREIYPLLTEVENVHIGISRFCGMGFIEDVVRRFGPQRLVFSSGMPVYTSGGPLTSLIYADISDDSKRMIAGNNIRSMLGEIDES